MILKRDCGPYTNHITWGFEQDMAYGRIFVLHLVLEDKGAKKQPLLSPTPQTEGTGNRKKLMRKNLQAS